MPHFISIHALFVLMDIVSSGLVDQSLRVRQAPNPDPLQYCGMKVELGGCPYECVQGKCPCYSYCADGPQVCGLANDPLQIAVYTYCKDPDNSIFNRCLQYCTDHCDIIDHDDGIYIPACVDFPKGPLPANRFLRSQSTPPNEGWGALAESAWSMQQQEPAAAAFAVDDNSFPA